ncbi:acetolactate synthase-1/2/3 large subunit [Paraburkholderia eburnea]|uniref:Acetolactate synthase-1/2/3 large subunit n=1 Tax=Paraburkholderia eburnea TaxID=1189126 RepID=A0A2S4LZ31_9BURK|nr:acetolactate synthase large subunit [Paraburkholderia eburnea]POR47716.1 acetolactate synthase-1/2/3 large subunit [Paraburkholderia eburnea]PRZ19218.1 acetolactate synthase-1/2/3 large subunit [Paraburkholderia eburnea]
MNGAESLLRSLVASGVEVCFGNPGTSEMHFVAALDEVPGMRPVLGLFEGVVTGAADGYGRMAGKPACTLLHLGPGLANGLANLHNARRASSPVVNIVGDHASSHSLYEAPLTSDIPGFARPVSHWIHASKSALTVGADAARAVQAARTGAGQIATLILPADTAWSSADGAAAPLPVPTPAHVDAATIERIAALAQSGARTAFLLRGNALQGEGLRAAGRIAAKTGARLLCDTFAPRIERGAGRVRVERLPYFAEQAVEFLAGTELLVLVGTQAPVSFFGYPDKPSWLTPQGCRIAVLAHPHEDGAAALVALADALGAGQVIAATNPRASFDAAPDGVLNGETIMRSVARHLPEHAIITEEASLAMGYSGLTEAAAPHDLLTLTGGAIGCMMPVSVGAGIACPERKVVNLQGDGSAMYTVQSLWTQARENIDVVTVIYANRGYRILANELKRVNARTDGAHAASMFDLENPTLDWVALAQGMGVEAVRVESAAAFDTAFAGAMKRHGPMLIEAVI